LGMHKVYKGEIEEKYPTYRFG